MQNELHLESNACHGIHWLGFLFLVFLQVVFPFSRCKRPNVKAPMPEDIDFPRAPDSFSFPKPAIKNIVGPNVTLGPMAFAALRIVFAFDQEEPDIIPAVAAH